MHCTFRHGVRAVVAAAVLAGAVGCSGGGSGTAPAVDSTPAVSLPGDAPSSGAAASPTPTPAQKANFSDAVEFTRLVHIGDYGAAGGMVADNSPAARYIAHQIADRRAYELNGQPVTENESSDVSVDGDNAASEVHIEIVDGDTTTKYTWKDFAFDERGKITAWTGKSGPIDKALWRKSDSASAHGVTARLISAYVTNAGTLVVVVELASPKRAIRVDDAAYTTPDGYRQEDNAGLYTDVGKGEKAMTSFSFPKAKLGGKVRIELGRVDPNDTSSSWRMGSVTLAVK